MAVLDADAPRLVDEDAHRLATGPAPDVHVHHGQAVGVCDGEDDRLDRLREPARLHRDRHRPSFRLIKEKSGLGPLFFKLPV